MAGLMESLNKSKTTTGGSGLMGSLVTIQNTNNAITNATPQVATPTANKEASENNGGFVGGLGYLGEKASLGFLSGIEGIWDYAAGGIAKLFGADDWAEQQFANDWVNYNHADEWYNPSSGWQIAGDVAGGIGTSLPAIAGVAVGGAIAYFSGGSLSPLAAGIISASIAGLGAAGNATKEAYRETGNLGGKEFGYGALSGATEAGVELLSAGLTKGSGRIVSSIAKSTSKEVTETVAKTGAKSIIKQLGEDFAQEAFEEGLSEFLSPVYQRMTYNPDAENASAQEIAYAALVGGLSGMVMSGSRVTIGAAVNTTQNYISGNNAVKNGTVESVMAQGERIANAESQHQTGFEAFQSTKETYDKLKASLATTGGKVTTVHQKMLLGKLKSASTVSYILPYVERSARGLVFTADVAAERYSTFGMTDANGKPMQFTKEQLLEGIDTELLEKAKTGKLTDKEARTFALSLRKAIQTNPVLSTLAVAEATGQIILDTRKMAEASLNGVNLANATDLNYLIEHGSQEEMNALSEAFGIEDWSTVTIDDFRAKVSEFNASGRISPYAEQSKRVHKAAETAAENAKPLPHILRRNMTDGVYRYKGNAGGVEMAVIKEGDNYFLYDYEGKNISRALTMKEVNQILKRYWTSGQTVGTTAKAEQNSQETSMARETAEIEAIAKEAIGEDYKKLNEPTKAAIRMTIRQAKAHGLSDVQTRIFAKVAARSGVNIIFDEQKALGDGSYSVRDNAIYVNPNNSEARTYEIILGHEMFHAIFADGEKGALSLFLEAKKLIDNKTAENTRKRYKDFYAQTGTVSATMGNVIAEEEVAARGVEEAFKSEKVWDYILSKEPSFADKVLSFFRQSAREYSELQGMSAQARKFIRQYKKLFESLSEKHQGTNALALTLEGENAKKTTATSTIDENMHVTGDNDEANETIEADDGIRHALCEFEDGKRFVMVEIDQDQFDGLSIKEQTDLATKVIKSRFQGKVIGLDNKAFVNGVTANEYTHPSKHIDDDLYTAKMRASTELDNLMDAGFNFRMSADGRDGHIHASAVGGFGYFDVVFRVANEYYQGVINIENNRRGKRLKDITKIENITKDVTSQYGNNPTYAFLRDASMDSIHENGEKSNPSAKNSSKNSSNLDKEYLSAVKGGDMDAAQNMVDEAAKKAGYTVKGYHGTKNDFTVFDKSKIGSGVTMFASQGRGFYFTESESVATKYSNGGKVLSSYLKANNLFSFVDKKNENSNRLLDEFAHLNGETFDIKQYSGFVNFEKRTGSILSRVVKDKGEAFTAFLQDKGFDGILYTSYDYDAGGSNKTYVVFEPEQIKSAAPVTYDDNGNVVPLSKRFDAGNPDMRYALKIGSESVPVKVEESGDLIAIHNLTEQNLLDTLELGGFPMPSIAIVRRGQEHSNYGNISVVFGKSTIDPEASADNKVYGSDAWTPTSSNARIEYQVDYEALRAFEKKLAELGKKVVGGAFSSESLVRRLGVEDTSEQNASKIAERLSNFDEVRAAFLAYKGEDVEPEYKAKVYNRFGNAALQKYIDTVGVERLATVNAEMQLGERDAISAEEETVRDIIRESYITARADSLNRRPELKEKRINAYIEKQVNRFAIEDFVRNAWEYYQEGGTVTEEVDRLATSDKLRQAVNDSEVRAWLEPQIEAFLGERGVRNNKDPFDSLGRSRSFSQLHYSYTVENIVRAMKETANARGANTFGVNANTLIATATPSYRSVDEMHADKARLKTEDAATYEAIVAKLEKALEAVERDIMHTTKHHSDDYYDEEQIIGSIIAETATKVKTAVGVQRQFSKEGYSITLAQAKKVLNLYAMAAEVPTGYFEAKPERVVAFEEIKMVELPSSTSETLITKLSDRKIPYEIYGETDAERTAAIDNLEGVRFALPDTDSEGSKLAAAQKEYFADSKVLDTNGRLLVVYHGTNADFYTFEKGHKRTSGMLNFGDGYYFAVDKSTAEMYMEGKDARILECYINIRNPYVVYWSRFTQSDYDDISQKLNGETVNYENVTSKLTQLGYDGVIVKKYNNTTNPIVSVVAFSSEQIKLTSNKAPSINSDMRYALFEDENLDDFFEELASFNDTSAPNFDIQKVIDRGLPRHPGASTLTVGELKKVIANNTRDKVYSKKTALDIVSRFYGVADLSPKTRGEIADALWQGLNDCKDAEERANFAHDMAEFIVAKMMTEAVIENPDVVEAQEKLTYLSAYIGKISFHPTDISELRHVADKDGLRKLLGRWGYKGRMVSMGNGVAVPAKRVPMDVFVCDIAREMPGMADFENMHPAEAFIELDAIYERAREDAKDKWISAYWDMPDSDIPAMVQGVEETILKAFDEDGTKSKFAKLVEGKIEHAQQRADFWKAEHDNIKGRDRLLGLLMARAQKMNDLRIGKYKNSTQFESDLFRNSVEKLAKIKFRGNLNVSGTRKIFADLLLWYQGSKTTLLEYQDAENPGYYSEAIEEALRTIADGQGGFTKADLSTMIDVMGHFIHFVENYGKVWRSGQLVEALPLAQEYNRIIERNKSLKVGLFHKLAGSWYGELFLDPQALCETMDYYDHGFFSQMFEELRSAAKGADVAKMDIMSEYDDFLHANKKYMANISTETVEYRGHQIPKAQLIDLYLTMKRKQAWAGAAYNGFNFKNLKGEVERVNGFLAAEVETEEELEAAIRAELDVIAMNFTDEDRAYMAIVERGYNERAKALKVERDMARMGYTNASDGYYYPISRAYTSKTIDADPIKAEFDRVSNASFNKDIVKGARQELALSSVDARYRRHIYAVCQYAYLQPAIETFNRLYNLDISGNKNHPVNVRTATENLWKVGRMKQGAANYFKKLISDIQGIQTGSSEGMAALAFIRGSHAKYQLGANPKVWFTQLSSIFASTSILDFDCIMRGMSISSSDIDRYCPLARLRNYDNTAAMAQGVLDRSGKAHGRTGRLMNKVGEISDLLMKPIGMVDRFVVSRLFGACQVQVEKNGGAKVGTEENKIEAGKLLEKVIFETQQNSIATERSAAMRSSNEILRTLTMFTSDSMKVIGRVISAYGEVAVLKARIKAETDADAKAELQVRLKTAQKRLAKSSAALIMTVVFMALIAQAFRWLYKKDDEDDNIPLNMTLDAVGNLFGGLPLVKDAYAKLVEGYDLDNYAYSAVNDLLDGAKNLMTTAGNVFSKEASSQDVALGIKNFIYSVGQTTGIPVRNIYNVFYGLTKRFNGEAAYKIDNVFYEKNYKNDFYKAMENGDGEMANFITSLLYNERMGVNMSEAVHSELYSLSAKGYKVIPKSAPSSITVNGQEYELSEAEIAAIRANYSSSQSSLEALFNNESYNTLSDEMKAEAVNYVYDIYYDQALESVLGVDKGNAALLANVIGADSLALLYVATKGLESDKDKNGQTVSGSKRKKVVAAINKLKIPAQQKLLLICAKGYSLKDGDIRGYSAEKAEKYLLNYLLRQSSLTKEQKAELAVLCGFEIKNGKIVQKSSKKQN